MMTFHLFFFRKNPLVCAINYDLLFKNHQQFDQKNQTCFLQFSQNHHLKVDHFYFQYSKHVPKFVTNSK